MSYLNSAISIFILFLFGTTSEVVAQDRFNGFVQDAETSEGLPFATVQTTPNGLITSADVNGYFTLELMVELTDSLKFSYVGYQTQVFALSAFTNSKTAVVKLASASVLPTIEVTLPKTAYGISSSVMTPSVAELARIPALGGEVDLLKGLALLPGISTGSEGSAAINIRGGSPNQTDLLIDGNRVYNVNHIGGFLSALPPFGVKALTVFKGGVPSRYGGRLSGVVDITLKEGRRDQLVKSFTLGLGTLQAAAEGPVGQNASFLVAGRYSYPTLIYNFANLNSYKRYESGYFQTVGLYDFVGKYGYNFNKHKITFSTFLSGDRGIDQNAFNGNVVADDFRWANHSYTLTHQYRTAQGGVWTNALQYLNYHYAYDSRQIPRRQAEQVITSSRSTLSNQVHVVWPPISWTG